MKNTIELQLIERKKNNLGHHPVWLKITIDRKTRYISSGKFIDAKYWDEKNESIRSGHPMAETWNGELLKLKSDASQKALSFSLNDSDKSATQLKRSLKKNIEEDRPGTNIFNFVDEYIAENRIKRKSGTIKNYTKHALKLELYHGSRDLTFEEIDGEYLINFEQDLRKTVGVNYAWGIMKTLRSFFNNARKKKIIDCYPFALYEMPKYLSPGKEYLSLTEIKKIEKYAIAERRIIYKEIAVYFILGCLTGLRLSDWYTFDVKKNVGKDYVKLRTLKNNQFIAIPISPILKRHLPRLSQMRLTTKEQVINRYLKTIAEKIGISKRISTHVARHTFAITMCAERGLSAETCAELMGIKLNTCVDNYYKVTAEKIKRETSAAWKSIK